MELRGYGVSGKSAQNHNEKQIHKLKVFAMPLALTDKVPLLSPIIKKRFIKVQVSCEQNLELGQNRTSAVKILQ
jgi:hypothetical protein